MCMLKLKFIVMIHALFTSIFKENEVHSFIDVCSCVRSFVRSFAPPPRKSIVAIMSIAHSYCASHYMGIYVINGILNSGSLILGKQ